MCLYYCSLAVLYIKHTHAAHTHTHTRSEQSFYSLFIPRLKNNSPQGRLESSRDSHASILSMWVCVCVSVRFYAADMCKLFFCRRRRRLFRRSLAALSLPPSPSLALSLSSAMISFFWSCKSSLHCALSPTYSLSLSLSVLSLSQPCTWLWHCPHMHTHTLISFVCSCLFCLRLLLIALSLIKSTVWQLAENGKQIKGDGREREWDREAKSAPPWHLWNYNLFKQPPHVQPPLHPAFPPSLISMPYTLLFILFSFPFPSFTPFPQSPLDKYYEVVFICGDATPDLELSSSICCCRNTFLDSISLSFNLIIHALSLPLSARTLSISFIVASKVKCE